MVFPRQSSNHFKAKARLLKRAVEEKVAVLTMTAKPPHEGVIAIDKPLGMTSALVSDIVKRTLSASALYAPIIEQERERRRMERQRCRGKIPRALRDEKILVKIGHGGTLDPNASGVLVLGIGSGTQALSILTTSSNKEYDAVLLFGATTDTFDADGRVVGRKSWEGVTREKVEAMLAEKFTGKIQQTPSVFSALKRGGIPMYDYARKGLAIPALQPREMTVHSIEVVEWMEGGTHQYTWPKLDIQTDRKDAFVQVLKLNKLGGVKIVRGSAPDPPEEGATPKKERQNAKKRQKQALKHQAKAAQFPDETTHEPDAFDEALTEDLAKDAPAGLPSATMGVVASPVKANDSMPASIEDAPTESASAEATHDGDANAALDTMTAPEEPQGPCPAPAVRIRMSVTSGFYVRSLCHDLAIAVGSIGLMASLRRTRQATFNVKDAVSFEDLDSKDESRWGPPFVKAMEDWVEKERALRAANKEIEDDKGFEENLPPETRKRKASSPLHETRKTWGTKEETALLPHHPNEEEI